MLLRSRLTFVATITHFSLANLHVASGFLGTFPGRTAAMSTKLDCSTQQTCSAPVVIAPNTPLPTIEDGVSVLSFNVLLPNGNDGWWIYKSYQPHVPEEHRAWSYRQALMKDYLLRKDADVVCIQEASAETFESDFAFMKGAGYGCVLHSKFRFRSATFFKTSKLELTCEKHKDRVLVTGFRKVPPAAQEPPPLLAVEPRASPPPPAVDAALADDPEAAVKSRAGGDQGGAGSNDQSVNGPQTSPTTAAAASGSVPLGRVAENSGARERLLMVVNCHLTGGPAPERRMRQVLDGLDTARKEAARLLSAAGAGGAAASGTKKKKGGGGGKGEGVAPTPGTSVPVVVCGDFNSNGRTAVWELLTNGVVEASYRERGFPEIAITSKDKKQGFGSFGDVYEEAYGLGPFDGDRGATWRGESSGGTGPPPTFLVPLLHPHFVGEDGEGLSSRLQVALSEVFNTFASSCDSAGTVPAEAPFLPREGVEAWLLKINRALGRGSEFRAAEAMMGPAPEGGLALQDFFSIYAMELAQGKFWGVAHDLHACGVELPGGMPWVGPYAARFDRVFYSKATLEAVGAMEPLSLEKRLLVDGGDCLPNSWHPSDHLAVAGAFRFR